jgi:septal ring factor EnvC (AmiA/AmiB activator)
VPEQFALYADAILLMACLGASLVCLRLHRELKRLRLLDGGLGKAVKEMNAATGAVRDAQENLRDQIQKDLAELDRRCAALKSKRQEIDDLLDAMEGQAAYQSRKCRNAQDVAERALLPLISKAEVEIRTLTQAIEVASQLGARPAPMPQPPANEQMRAADLSSRHAPRTTRVTDQASNPFLRSAAHG